MGTQATIDPLLIAQDAWAFVRPGPSDVLDDQGDVVLFHRPRRDPLGGGACRVRFAAGAAGRRVRDVRAWMASHGRNAFTWWLGASTTPIDLADRLLSRGPMAASLIQTLTPMALENEPPMAPAGVEVRLIASVEEDVSGRRTSGHHGCASEVWSAFRARRTAALDMARADDWFRFGVWVDGELAAWALLLPLRAGPPFLAGLSECSKQSDGARQALLRASWDTAVGLGAPGLVTQAPSSERPTLARLGFRAGPPIRRLADVTYGSRPDGWQVALRHDRAPRENDQFQ